MHFAILIRWCSHRQDKRIYACLLCFIRDIHGCRFVVYIANIKRSLSLLNVQFKKRTWTASREKMSCVLSGKYMTVCLNECRKCIVRRNDQTLRILLNQLPTICPSHNWRSLFLLLVFQKRSKVLQNYFTYYKVAPFVFSSSEENEQGTNSRQLSSAVSSSPFSTICFLAQCLNGVRNR